MPKIIKPIRLEVVVDKIENINEFMFVRCLESTCVNHLAEVNFCNLKHIRIIEGGVCGRFKPRPETEPEAVE